LVVVVAALDWRGRLAIATPAPPLGRIASCACACACARAPGSPGAEKIWESSWVSVVGAILWWHATPLEQDSPAGKGGGADRIRLFFFFTLHPIITTHHVFL
jgi:hypothetical protein